MDDALIQWMLKLDASAAAKELAAFAGTAEDQLDALDHHAKALKFAEKIGWAANASPSLGKVLTELAAVRKSAFGVEAALQIASRSSTGFEDLTNELSTINQLFKDGVLGAEQAQRAFSEVGKEGGRRKGDAAQLADDNAREEEAHWRKIDKEREEAAKRLVKIAQDNLANEETHWAKIDRERERAATDFAKKVADAETVRANKVRQSITELKTMAGMGVAGGLATIGMSARAGFQDTMQGQQSQAYGQLLNRQVASIFAPLLEEKTKYVAQMTSWLQGLSEPQKKSIVAMTVFGTSMTALSLTVPRALKAMATLATEGALGKTLQGMTAQGGALGGAAAMAHPIGLAIAAGFAVLAATPQGRESLAELGKSLTPILETFGDVLKEVTPIFADTATGLAMAISDMSDFTKWVNAKLGGQGDLSIAKIIKEQFAFVFNPGSSIMRLFGVNPNEGVLGNQSGSSLSGVPKGLEDIGRDFERILEASTKMDLQQRQVVLLEQIATNTAPAPTPPPANYPSGGFTPGVTW